MPDTQPVAHAAGVTLARRRHNGETRAATDATIVHRGDLPAAAGTPVGLDQFARAGGKLNFVDLSGLLAGGTTNPPALTFATGLAGSAAPTAAYATVYPLTLPLRILAAQVLTLILIR